MLYKSEDRITKQCVVTERPRTQTVLLVIVKMAQIRKWRDRTQQNCDLHWWIHLLGVMFPFFDFRNT